MKFSELAKFQHKQLNAWYKLFTHKYLLYGGAAGGGKSYFLRWAAIGLGMYYSAKYNIQGVPIGLFSEDYPTLKDRQIRRIKMEVPSWLAQLKESKEEGLVLKSSQPKKWGDWSVLLRNLDDPSKYASAEFAAILVEELTKNPRETFDDLRFRLRFPGVSDPKFVGATNPGSIGHAWVKQLWIQPDPKSPDPEQESFIYVPARVDDNKYIDKGYVVQLESLPEQKRKAFLEGSWDIFAGQVFSEWRDSSHVIEPFEIPMDWPRYLSLDGGYNKPFSLGWWASDYDGHYYRYREIYLNSDGFLAKYGKPLTAETLADMINEVTEPYEYCVADTALWNKDLISAPAKDGYTEGESVAETMIRKGVKLIRATKDRYNGLQRFHQMLAIAPDGRPWAMSFKNCFDFNRTIPALVYDEHKVEDVDTEGEDHAYDDARYFFMSRPAPAVAPEPPKSMIRQHYENLLYRRQMEEYTHGSEHEDF